MLFLYFWVFDFDSSLYLLSVNFSSAKNYTLDYCVKKISYFEVIENLTDEILRNNFRNDNLLPYVTLLAQNC